MAHTYQFSGITCNGCAKKVTAMLSQIEGITNVAVVLETQNVTVTMQKHIPMSDLAKVFEGTKYSINNEVPPIMTVESDNETGISWLATYKPIVLIFAYITLVSFLTSANNLMDFMRYFMAAFFLVFSFFKMLNLKGFVESYQMYDVVARRFPVWGYVYVFTELGLGVAYLTNFQPFMTNVVTLIVMSVSIIGVLQTVLNKKKIQCACLGAVFNLPMSSVTIIEDGLMIVMSVAMLML
jgi:copper chaperone CopZ